ncbi:MAG: ABC transporter ATP-binding protein [Proteobacteria bacterium]|nr:ABC transporter ATP-binding protein [Pseudomonadota bacterium]
MNKNKKDHILACRDLIVGYKGKIVLSGLNMDFEKGQFISLLGPNGAGKTTLLRTLSRHLDPLGGHIELMGRPLSDLNAMELARIMAIVLTDKVSPPLFTVFEFVVLGRYPHTNFLGRLSNKDHSVVQNALIDVHAKNLSHRPFADLSDGERQKVLVARALAQQPLLLLLDEPTIHLDLKHRVEVMSILRDLCRTQGITVVASMHDIDVAAKVSDKVALLKGGSLNAWGAPESVLTSRAVTDLYDFNGANFNQRLGSIELRGNGNCGRAFVVAGMGSGAMVYRMLAKRGYSIATGIVHTNDLDFYVAKSLGAHCTVHSPMKSINGICVRKAIEQMDDCDVVIDCGFEINQLNRCNLSILKTALKNGKPVLTMRRKKINSLLKPSTQEHLIRCSNIGQLFEELDRLTPNHNFGRYVPEKQMEAQ